MSCWIIIYGSLTRNGNWRMSLDFSLLNDTHTWVLGILCFVSLWLFWCDSEGTWWLGTVRFQALVGRLRRYLVYFVWLLFLPFWRDSEILRFQGIGYILVYFLLIHFGSSERTPKVFGILFNSIYLEYFVFFNFGSSGVNYEENEDVKVYQADQAYPRNFPKS